MNFLKKIKLFFILSIFSYSSQAQTIHFGATLNPGISSQETNYFDLFPSGKTTWALSGNLGFFVEKPISKSSSLVAEILLTHIRTTDKTDEIILYDFPGTFEQIEIGRINNEWTVSKTYLALPISYNLQFSKLGFRIGVQPMIFLYGRSKSRVYGVINNLPYNDSGTTENIKFNYWDIGPKLGINYLLLDYLKLRMDYYHGFIDVIAEDSSLLFRKSRQVTLGADLYF